MNILVFGATGFVGSHVLKHLEQLDAQITIALRPKEKNPTTFDALTADITNAEAVASAVAQSNPDIIVHLVGIIEEHQPHVTFENIHIRGTKHLVEAAKKEGVNKIIYISALGASEQASTKYYHSKFQAEQLIQESGIDFTILRPSLMFGEHAGFTNQVKDLFSLPLPFVPLIGNGNYPFKPVAVDITAACIKQACEGIAKNQIVDVIGPEEISLRELFIRMKKQLQSKKLLLPIPLFFLRIIASLRRIGIPSPISTDQLIMILEGNTSNSDQLSEVFSIEQIPFNPNGDYPLF